MVRARGAGVSITQIARDFRVHDMTPRKRFREADIEYENIMNRTVNPATRQGDGHLYVRQHPELPALIGILRY